VRLREADGEAVLRLAAGGGGGDARRRSARRARRRRSGSLAREGGGGVDPRQARGRGPRGASRGSRGAGREAAPAQRVQSAALAGRREASPAGGRSEERRVGKGGGCRRW